MGGADAAIVITVLNISNGITCFFRPEPVKFPRRADALNGIDALNGNEQ